VDNVLVEIEICQLVDSDARESFTDEEKQSDVYKEDSNLSTFRS